MDNNTPKNGNNLRKPRLNLTWLYILIIGGLIFMFMNRSGNSVTKSVDYSEFKKLVNNGYVSEITINTDDNTLVLAIDSKHKKEVFGNTKLKRGQDLIQVDFGSVENLESFIDNQTEEKNFTGKVKYERNNDLITNILWNFAPFIRVIRVIRA